MPSSEKMMLLYYSMKTGSWRDAFCIPPFEPVLLNVDPFSEVYLTIKR